MAIGERIHFFRLLRGMTQKYLGMALGFPEKSADVRLAQYETGSRTPKADLTAALAQVLDVSLHMPPQKCSLTADDGASPPLEWCTHSAEMVHGGRRRGTPDRHAGDYSGIPLRLRMDSPSIWMV